MKRTVEIEDSLQDRVDTAIQEVEQELRNFLEENTDTYETPCLNNDLDYSGTIHEIVDGSVPIYTKEIEDTWYLYASELEEAYDNAGVGDDSRENDGMAAIYYYIMEKVQEWYHDNADDIFEEWQAEKLAKESKEIVDSYENGECPDCGEEIPDNVSDGDSCCNCEHVFTRKNVPCFYQTNEK
jgi:hypothetical protein